MKITKPEDVFPLMKKLGMEDGIPLFKYSKGFEFLDIIEPKGAKDILYIILRKLDANKRTYRILRYKKNIKDVSLDSEFKTVGIDDAVVKTIKAISQHLF